MPPPFHTLSLVSTVLGTTLCSVLWTFSIFFQKLPALPKYCSNLLVLSAWELTYYSENNSVRFYPWEFAKNRGFLHNYVTPTVIRMEDFLMLWQALGGGAWGFGDRHLAHLKLYEDSIYPCPCPISIGPNPLNLTLLCTGAEVCLSYHLCHYFRYFCLLGDFSILANSSKGVF